MCIVFLSMFCLLMKYRLFDTMMILIPQKKIKYIACTTLINILINRACKYTHNHVCEREGQKIEKEKRG